MSKIAIIGMGCLLPGYTTKNDLWDKLIAGECLTTKDNYKDKTIERGHLYKYQSDKFFEKYFPEERFNILNGKGEIYKWSSYVVEEALKDSGYFNNIKALKNTGIFMGTIGMFVPEYISMFNDLVKEKLNESINLLLRDGDFSFFNSKLNKNLKGDKCYVDTDNVNTIRELYNIKGPYMSVSAACATPLYAIKLACLYLENHKADMMVVGSNCENESISDVCAIFDSLGILVDKGMCNPLNKDSTGLIISSGAGAVVLKRLEDAIKDNDEILAVIDSIGWSNDGGAKSLLAPCSEGQMASFKDAYSNGVSEDIDYIECHSTGTAAGDMEEYKSISSYFGSKGIKPYIGTLKGNTGHFLTASAMGSIVKIILSMKNGIIPQTIRVNNPIGPEVVTKNIPWPKKGREKRAAVNAFGFGGINAHMVLKEYIKDKDEKVKLKEIKDEDIAIVGMDLQVGEVKNKETLYNYLLNSKTAVIDDGTIRSAGDSKNKKVLDVLGLKEYPKGAYINEISFDFLKFKFSAKQNMYYARRDMLLLNIANRALIDAGITVDTENDTAVIVNAGQDFAVLNYRVSAELRNQIIESFKKKCPGVSLEQRNEIFDILRRDEDSIESADSIVGIIPSIRGSRISAHWHFKGPSFILTEQDEALKHSLELAKILLNMKIVKCVVIGTVELLGETEFLFAQKINGTLDKVKEYGVGEGAAVLVLKTKEQAIEDKNRIYTSLDKVILDENNLPEDLLRNTIGYSGSLEQYTEIIVKALEKYYRFPVKESNIRTDSFVKTNILNELAKRAEKIDFALKNENKRSYIKNIKLTLPPLEERKSFKGNIHKFIYEKVINNKNSTLKSTCDEFIKRLNEENNKAYEFIMNKFKKKPCIFDRDEIIEMTNGSMSKVLGERYKILDSYKVRSRMPSPPYLFISRITKLNAEYGKLKPSMIEIEYDVDKECIYLQGDKTISDVVFTEASQIGIFLGSYIGADITDKGSLRFRIGDSKIKVIKNIPVYLGDTIRLVYRIDKFVNRGDTVVVFCSYECYKGNELILTTKGIGGFFTHEDLEDSKGLITPKFKLNSEENNKSLKVKKLRNKNYYEASELESYFEGKLSGCFNDISLNKLEGLHYINPLVRMLDSIKEIKLTGGKYGLGYISATKEIDASHWAFKAHFKNDPVFPGTLILNGANQLFLFFALHCGFVNSDNYKNIGAIEGLTTTVAFRGQVRPKKSRLNYVIDIKSLCDEGLIGEVNVYWEDINVIRQDDISIKL